MPRPRLDTAAVVDAAVALADLEGLASVTLARLAAELDVRPPSLYAHVASLEDLRRRIGARGAWDIALVLGRAAAGRAGTDALRAMADAHRAYALEHPGRYAAAQRSRELQSDPDAVAAGEAAAEVVFAVLRGYGLSGDDAVHAARAVRAALHGFQLLEVEQGFAIDVSPDESFARLVTILDVGMRGATRADGATLA